MCGFVGVYTMHGRGDARIEDIRAAAGLLAHRGPDDESYHQSPGFATGFRRLKILDLSERGRQPMSDESGRYWIVFNGEIYNYRELRQSLTQDGWSFTSTSDTEVLLKAYLHFGEACLDWLNGMFAFLIWDRQERRLFGARDRFGEKPLYYAGTSDGYIFGSEPKALIRLLDATPSFRPGIVRNYLQHGVADIGSDTFYEGIHALPAASKMTLSGAKLRIDRYWSLEANNGFQGNPAERFRELFIDSLKLRTRSDVPLGTCLSGGLDSGSIVCGLPLVLGESSEQATRKTFTAAYADYDETPYVDAANQLSGSIGHAITPKPSSLADLEELLRFHDEPFHSFAAWAGYKVMKLARSQDIVVLLNGQGADEMLAGYPSYFPYYLEGLLARGRFASIYAALRGAGPLIKIRTGKVLMDAMKLRMRHWIGVPLRSKRSVHDADRRYAIDRCHLRPEFLDEAEADPIERLGCNFPDPLKTQLWLSMYGSHMPLFLRVEDRNSMANSVESRLPFLDHRLAELAFSCDSIYHMKNGNNKTVLRDAMRGILPDKVLDRKDKYGFPTPQLGWIYRDLRDEIQDLLRTDDLVDGTFDGVRLRNRFEADAGAMNPEDKAGYWFRVVSFLLWKKNQRSWHTRP
jgi:asparagine synthase (glutamine-hydrolysing)